DPHVPARPRGLQSGERDRPARGGGLDVLRLVGLQDGSLRRDPLQRRDHGRARREGVDELRLRRARPAAVLGGGQGREVRRGERGRGPPDGHAESGLAARHRPAGGIDRGGQGRRHRDLQRPPLRARRARGADDRGRRRVFRPREGPRCPHRARGEGWRWAVRTLGAALLALLSAAAGAADVVAIRGGRIVTVSGPVIEKGTVVVSGGKITAVGASVEIPAGATVIDATGQTVYPGLIDGLTTLGLTEIGSVPGSVDTTETGDVNPHAEAWVAVNPHSDLLPVARANGITAALAAPAGGLVPGQSALLRLAGTTPDALTVKTRAAMHMVYPTGRPAFDISRLFEEPELKTFEERQKERKRNQEKDLKRLGNLLEEAKAYGAARAAARAGTIAPPPRPDLPMDALAPVARGEVPVVMRVDAEEDIRGAVRFAEEH